MKTISLKFRLPLFVAVVCCLSVPVRATAAVMAGTGAGICSEFVTGGVKKTNPVLRAGKVLCVPTGCGASTLKIPRRSMSPRRGCRGSFVPTARSMVSARAAGRCRSPRRRSCCVGAVPTVGTAAAWGVIRCGCVTAGNRSAAGMPAGGACAFGMPADAPRHGVPPPIGTWGCSVKPTGRRSGSVRRGRTTGRFPPMEPNRPFLPRCCARVSGWHPAARWFRPVCTSPGSVISNFT